MYFSVIDIMAEFSDTAADAKYYWRDMRQRLQKRRLELEIRKVKLSARDHKMRLTEVAPLETCLKIINVLQSQTPRDTSQVSELYDLHPLVFDYLCQSGFAVYHHWQLPSGKEVDFVAQKDSEILIVECKVSLIGEYFFNGVGQVLCYQQEFDRNSKPILATFAGKTDTYAQLQAKRLGISMIEVPCSQQSAKAQVI